MSDAYIVTAVSLWSDDVVGAWPTRKEAEAAMQRWKIEPPKGTRGDPIGLDLFRVCGESVKQLTAWRFGDEPAKQKGLFADE